MFTASSWYLLPFLLAFLENGVHALHGLHLFPVRHNTVRDVGFDQHLLGVCFVALADDAIHFLEFGLSFGNQSLMCELAAMA